MIPRSTALLSQEQLRGGSALTSEARYRKRLTRVMWFLIATAMTGAFFFPIYFMVSSSIKDNPEVLAMPIHWVPENFQGLSQYGKAFEQAPLLRYFFNSILMASVDVIVTVIFSAAAGYGFAKFNFIGKRLMF